MPEFNTVNTFDYGLIFLYFAILIWVGIYSSRKNRSTEDYFRGSGKIPWVLAGLSNWVSGFSAFMFVAAAGFAYQSGAGTILLFTSAFWAYLLGYGYFAARWRRARIHTPLEFLTRRFSPSTTYYYSLTAIVPQIVNIGQGLYILCIFVATALGFSERSFTVWGLELTGLQVSVMAVGTVMVVYTVIGGLWAAVLSDAVQSLIITTMTFLVFVTSFLFLGQEAGFLAGFERLMREAPEGFFSLNGDLADPLFLGAYFLNVLMGYNVGWALVQRYHSVPDESDARKMALLCAGLSAAGPLLWILPAMGARIVFPDIALLWPSLAVPAEASYVSLALLLLPHGLIGFVVSAILSATLGQANDSFNWLAATLTRDVYVPLRKRLRGEEPAERSQLRLARGTMLVVGVLGILVALYIPRFGGAFEFALQFYSLTAAFSMPVILGMIYTRTPWWSGIASCTAAVAAGIAMMTLDLWDVQPMVRNMFAESIAASVVFFGSALWWREGDPRNAGILRFAADLQRPVLVADKSVDPESVRVYGLLGTIAIVLGAVLLACTLLPSSPLAPPVINAVAGAALIGVGYILRHIARPKRKDLS